MSEQDSGVYPSGESSPVPDSSRSTAEFRAFASRFGESEAPWHMRAPGRKVALLAAAIIVVAVILALIALAIAR